ncbi:MAG: metallophosphoesterase, partial [Planctomycetota bacterium]|nr:metallophosphoesterase [Planctomycetota bacterium]
INVGSVGQPRDGNPMACYATFDGDSCVYRRVAYDTQEARRRVHEIADLDPFLGDRLVQGK